MNQGPEPTNHPVVAEIEAAVGAIREAIAAGRDGTYEPLRSAGVMIMKFRPEHAERFRLHAELLGELAGAGKLDAYGLWRLDLRGRDGLAGLLIVTGEAGALNNYSRHANYLPEADGFVANRCGNDWERINADGTESDIPAPGCALDLNGAARSMSELATIVAREAANLTPIT